MNVNHKFNYKLNKYLRAAKLNVKYKSSLSIEYQYLQKSIVPTYHFQKSLPRLPVPALSKTLERYLSAQKPLLSESDYKLTEKYVASFAEHGDDLNEELLRQNNQNSHTSYISEPWFDMYLSDRTPLPINYNPSLVFTNYNDSFYDQQLIKTANLLISSLRFYKSLKDEVLEPEVFHLKPKRSNTKFFRRFTSLLPSAISWYGAYLLKAYPLDMSQYCSLFSGTRIPKPGKDRLYHREDSKHVVVLRKGHFYIFDVLDKNGCILPPHIILSSLDYILKDRIDAPSHPLGLLTTGERNKWAETRQYLEKIGNAETLDQVDSALFAIALDDVIVNDPHDIVRWFLHSDGKNRWFDKSFTLITTANGYAGLNFEHSWGDGVAVLRYFTDIHKDAWKTPFVTPDTEVLPLTASEIPKRLNFVIDDKVKQDITQSKNKFYDVCKNLGVTAVIQELGRMHCAKYKVSPDAVMQLIFQLANFDLVKKTVPTYESCSTAAFKHGRTETVRPCTMETTQFCKSIVRGGVSQQDLVKLIKLCSSVHSELVKNAAMGQGFDRHLFALKKLAEKKSEAHDLFKDPNYAYMNHNILSTSTLNSELVFVGGFGPVVPDGYGIAYMIRKDTCGTVITNYINQTNAKKFSESMSKSMEIVKKLLTE